jgi:hypothetical protein
MHVPSTSAYTSSEETRTTKRSACLPTLSYSLQGHSSPSVSSDVFRNCGRRLIRKWMAALTVGVVLLVGHAQVHAVERKSKEKPKEEKSIEKNLGELNLAGHFGNPWKNPRNPKDNTEEVKAYREGRWAISSDTFVLVYVRQFLLDRTVNKSKVIPVGETHGFKQFLGLISNQAKDSIRRINLISHGGKGIIAFTGSIDAGTGKIKLDPETALDLRISDLEYESIKPGLQEESLGMIARKLRNRFQKGAEIVFYTCNSGVDLELLQAIANAFQVVASGFREKIWVCPLELMRSPYAGPTSPPLIPTWTSSLTSLDPSCGEPKPGFKHLDPYRIRRSPQPDPK